MNFTGLLATVTDDLESSDCFCSCSDFSS